MRARIRNKINGIEEIIEKIKCDELKDIAYMYYIRELSQIDIAYHLGLSEKTINRRIHEIKTRFFS